MGQLRRPPPRRLGRRVCKELMDRQPQASGAAPAPYGAILLDGVCLVSISAQPQASLLHENTARVPRFSPHPCLLQDQRVSAFLFMLPLFC